MRGNSLVLVSTGGKKNQQWEITLRTEASKDVLRNFKESELSFGGRIMDKNKRMGLRRSPRQRVAQTGDTGKKAL